MIQMQLLHAYLWPLCGFQMCISYTTRNSIYCNSMYHWIIVNHWKTVLTTFDKCLKGIFVCLNSLKAVIHWHFQHLFHHFWQVNWHWHWQFCPYSIWWYLYNEPQLSSNSIYTFAVLVWNPWCFEFEKLYFMFWNVEQYSNGVVLEACSCEEDMLEAWKGDCQ